MKYVLNKVILQGRLAAEPELGQTKNGKTFTVCSIAVEDNKLIDGKRKVNFFKAVAWSEKAEFISNYFSKGQYILVDGRLVSDTYTDKKGNLRKDVFVCYCAIKVNCNYHIFLLFAYIFILRAFLTLN